MFHLEKIVAHQISECMRSSFVLSELHYPDISIPNRSLAWYLDSKEGDSDEIRRLKGKIAEYNAYIGTLKSIKSFAAVFEENHYCLKKDTARLVWGSDIADKIFDLHDYPFETPLKINGEWLFSSDFVPCYEVVAGEENITFEVGPTDSGYPSQNQDESKFFLWNWMDDYRDLCFALWDIFDRVGWLPTDDGNDEPIKDYSGFECYDQYRYDMQGPDVNLWRCAQILMDSNYLKVYEIRPENENPWWNLRGTSVGTIIVGVLDQGFLKNKVQKDKLRLALSVSEEKVRTHPYILLDSGRKPYFSKLPAQYGGHYKLKIYGHLDCPSAARYIARGQYVQQRVFFSDEKTAVKAGFHPCGVCMKAAHDEWMKSQKER